MREEGRREEGGLPLDVRLRPTGTARSFLLRERARVQSGLDEAFDLVGLDVLSDFDLLSDLIDLDVDTDVDILVDFDFDFDFDFFSSSLTFPSSVLPRSPTPPVAPASSPPPPLLP